MTIDDRLMRLRDEVRKYNQLIDSEVLAIYDTVRALENDPLGNHDNLLELFSYQNITTDVLASTVRAFYREAEKMTLKILELRKNTYTDGQVLKVLNPDNENREDSETPRYGTHE